MRNVKSAIESLLLTAGDPVEVKALSRAAETSEEEVLAAIKELSEEYKDRGFRILEKDEKFQLGTNPENAPWVEKLSKEEFTAELSRAALETVAIIAYKGPLTRAEIEYMRGVNSSFILRNLLLRGLIEKIENPKDARSFLYRVSFEFLKHFGLSSPRELPRYEEFTNKKIKFPDENVRERDNPEKDSGSMNEN